jgi:hypothetical protein
MVKQKKRRTKKYSGADAAVTRPVVTRVRAANRNKLGQWWFERKRILKPVLITSGIVTLLVWLTIEIIRIASGS